MPTTTQLKDLFRNDITRNIEPVIKADDNENLLQEVKEYVITKDVASLLQKEFLDRYKVDRPQANGVWISGFYGSGKSHLLKMLSLLLENRKVDGQTVGEHFQGKIEDDAILAGDLLTVSQIPATSILFNIDSDSNRANKDQSDAVLRVFQGALDTMQGYSKSGFLAQLEREMANGGTYEAFKEAFEKISGRTWKKGRRGINVPKTQELYAKAYVAVHGGDEGTASKMLENYRATYVLSVESFAERVRAFLDTKESKHRLNFFVDEVGQYISDDTQLMTNLQTIAEKLMTVCDGRAWIIVTSQEDIKGMLGKDKMKGADFTKIRARFPGKLNLSSKNVDEVIQTRLLGKNELGKETLAPIYQREQNNLATLFSFREGTSFPVARSEKEFIKMYPFQPFHFLLLQESLRRLAAKDAFPGDYFSVGERSLLSFFQDTVKAMMEQGGNIERLPTFDLMYDAMRTELRGEIQSSINLATQTIEHNPLAIRALKILFLTKGIKGFVPTPANVATLLVDRFDINQAEHVKDVKIALSLLETARLVRRTGEEYIYLTDEERDVQKEIGNIRIEESLILKELGDWIFDDVIKLRNKINYEGNGQTFTFSTYIDEQLHRSAKSDLRLMVFTHLSNVHGTDLMLSHSMDKPEVRLMLPEDLRLIDDVRQYLRTKSYGGKNGGLTGEVRMIIDAALLDNNRRQDNILRWLEELIGRCRIVISGAEVRNISATEPGNRAATALQQLVGKIYTNLRMIPKDQTESDLRRVMTSAPERLLGEEGKSLSEAESHVFMHVNRIHKTGQRISAYDLQNQFAKAPYGWSSMATLTIIGRLLSTNRLEARKNSELLDRGQSLAALTNNRTVDSVLLTPIAKVSAGEISKLKKFHSDLFDKPNVGTDGTDVAKEFQTALKEEKSRVGELIRMKEDYFFVKNLEPYAEALTRFSRLPHAEYYTSIAAMEKELFDARDEHYIPLEKFLFGAEGKKGEQRKIYDNIKLFVERGVENHRHLSRSLVAPLQDVLREQVPYGRNIMNQAKTALDAATQALQQKLKEARNEGLAQLQKLSDRLTGIEQYTDLNEVERKTVEDQINRVREQLEDSKRIDSLQSIVGDFQQRDYNSIYSYITTTSYNKNKPAEKPVPPSSSTSDKPASGPKPPMKVEEPRITYLPLMKPDAIRWTNASIKIETPEDIDRFLEAYRKAIEKVLATGKGLHF
jgi:energy-coupling factor transporter ATP-binding protein EcfA2